MTRFFSEKVKLYHKCCTVEKSRISFSWRKGKAQEPRSPGFKLRGQNARNFWLETILDRETTCETDENLMLLLKLTLGKQADM
jgi:hypothetical protein